ncbi:MAG: aminotransferase class IV [Edaphocola sp.]
MAQMSINGYLVEEQAAVFTGLNLVWRSGAALVETMLWRNGGIRLGEEHLNRINSSTQLLEWPCVDTDKLSDAIIDVVKANHLPERAVVRLQLFPEGEQTTSFVINTQPPPEPGPPLSIGWVPFVVTDRQSTSHLKTASRLIYHYADTVRKKKGWDDLLLLNNENCFVESTISNLFLIKDQKIITPPQSDGCIAGVMRRHLINSGEILGMAVEEASISFDDLNNATEVFLTNAVRGIRPVAKVNNRLFPTELGYQLLSIVNQL